MEVIAQSAPFALSLSKGCPSGHHAEKKGQGFDKLSPNGFGGVSDAR
jgi:hypothetical protein